MKQRIMHIGARRKDAEKESLNSKQLIFYHFIFL